MIDSHKTLTRRALVLTGAASCLAQPALADGPALSKASVGYRDVPYEGKVCAQCVYFEFYPTTGTTPGSRCKLVAGPISPAGWCEVWAPKG